MQALITANHADIMTYIHERTDWPNFTWDSAKLSPVLAEVRHKQGRLLGRMEGLGFQLRNEASLATLTSDVVKSSAIEGEVLSPELVRSSIARRLGMDIGGAASINRDVEGIVEMMLDATQRFTEPLTAERLFGWHASLFPTGRSGMHKITVGAWRPAEIGAMQVVSGAIGRENVHFEAPTAEKLESEMTALIQWFESRDEMDPVLRAALAHLWFVTIHPFEDGNGRIGRAIADMALARADGAKDYYLNLEQSQRGTLDVTSWMEWFLGCLERAIAGADETLSKVLRKAKIWDRVNQGLVNERQRAVINRLMDDFVGKLTSSKYAKLAKCSEDTALRDIRALMERGIFVQNEGGGRSTSYALVELV